MTQPCFRPRCCAITVCTIVSDIVHAHAEPHRDGTCMNDRHQHARHTTSIPLDLPSARLFLLGIVSGLCVLSGCGFVLHGGKQDIVFDSKPPGVAVTLDHTMQFVTPHTVTLSRSTPHHAIFKKEGYQPQQYVITPEFMIGSAIIGNILPFFPVGLAIDIMTGSAWGFERDYLAIEMVKSTERP